MSALSLMTNVVPIIVIVLLTMIANRIATIALTLTGMSRQSASFQARSALTAVGFATSESESVVNHPVRRRIIMSLMLVGSAGIVAAIATLAATTSRTVAAGEEGLDLWATYLVMVAGIAALLLLLRVRVVDRALSRLIKWALRRYTDLEVADYAALLELHGGYAVTELLVQPGTWLADQTLAELRPNDEGILVLGMHRDSAYIGAPTGALRILPGDTLLLYGPHARIAELDSRPPGVAGESLRNEAVAHERERRRQDRAVAGPPGGSTGAAPERNGAPADPAPERNEAPADPERGEGDTVEPGT